MFILFSDKRFFIIMLAIGKESNMHCFYIDLRALFEDSRMVLVEND
jgi:hypothetical protein